METRYHRLDGVVASDLGHELVLYDPAEREVLVLNLTARFVWMLCATPHSIIEIARALLESFNNLDFDIARRDVENLIQAHGRFFCSRHSDDPPSEPAKSLGQKPRYLKPAVQKIGEAQFIEQSRGLAHSVDPFQFGDSWEGCDGDAAR